MEQKENKQQQIEALRKHLTVADQEAVCAEFNISRPTWYRKLSRLDLSDKVTAAMVARAAANKAAAEQTSQQLSSLV